MDPSAQPQVSAPVLPSQTPPSSVSVPVEPTSLAQPIVQAASSLPSQPVSGAPLRAKEAAPVSAEVTAPIEVVGSDALEKEPLPPEVSSWMEKVNRDNSGEKPPEVVVADISASNPSGSYASHPVFVLPLGDDDYKRGLN